jgi:hypothetical protein
MPQTKITLLTDSGTLAVDDCEIEEEDLWLGPDDLLSATGFELEPEGLCRKEACFPLPPGQVMVRGDDVNVAEFWRYRGGPVLHTEDRSVWLLGEPAGERAGRLQSLEAPDFTLPDARGEMHSLSDYRGRKVLLATWASW